MSKAIQEIATFALSGSENGKIEVATLSEPYGPESEPVVSIGVFLNHKSEEPDWKVHIPRGNITEVITALEDAKAAL